MGLHKLWLTLLSGGGGGKSSTSMLARGWSHSSTSSLVALSYARAHPCGKNTHACTHMHKHTHTRTRTHTQSEKTFKRHRTKRLRNAPIHQHLDVHECTHRKSRARLLIHVSPSESQGGTASGGPGTVDILQRPFV